MCEKSFMITIFCIFNIRQLTYIFLNQLISRKPVNFTQLFFFRKYLRSCTHQGPEKNIHYTTVCGINYTSKTTGEFFIAVEGNQLWTMESQKEDQLTD